jgi:hypothetical protein
LTQKHYKYGPVSAAWKGAWKSAKKDPEVTEEAFRLASELLTQMLRGFEDAPYARGDFFGDRTLYVEVKDRSSVTAEILESLRKWLEIHPTWRVVIPVGKHEEPFIVYRDAIFHGLEEI